VEFMAPPTRGSSGFATDFEEAAKGVSLASTTIADNQGVTALGEEVCGPNSMRCYSDAAD
jgi:hypothetical protein